MPGETPESLVNLGDCQMPASVMRSIFSHRLLDKPASELYQRSLEILRMGLDKASLSLAANVVPIKHPIVNIVWARVTSEFCRTTTNSRLCDSIAGLMIVRNARTQRLT